MSTLEIILTFISGGGVAGVVSLLTINSKRKQAKTDAMKGQADLAEEILQKYLKSVSDKIDQNEAERLKQIEASNKQVTDALVSVQVCLSDVVEYLNGDFAEFRKVKRNAKGQFVSSKS